MLLGEVWPPLLKVYFVGFLWLILNKLYKEKGARCQFVKVDLWEEIYFKFVVK